MNIIVCIKPVLMEMPSKMKERAGAELGLNPFDRPALETALSLKEAHGGSVTALAMGPASATDALLEAMAMGADKAVLLCDKDFAGADTLATSNALAAAVKKLAPFDIIVFGARSSDSDTGQVGPQTAVLLDLPMVCGVVSIEKQDSSLLIERRADGFREKFKAALTAAISVHPAAVKPRDVALGGIEDAYGKGEVEVMDARALGLSSEQVGLAGSPTRVRALKLIDRGRKCEFIEGSVEEQAEELARRLVDKGLIG